MDVRQRAQAAPPTAQDAPQSLEEIAAAMHAQDPRARDIGLAEILRMLAVRFGGGDAPPPPRQPATMLGVRG